jgi:oligopeptide/dipeptide ABC transporter ATP-binding protein
VPVLGKTKETLTVIPGVVPNLIDLPSGCRFAARCAARQQYGVEPAVATHPELRSLGPGHEVRCWLYHSDDSTPGWKPPLAEAKA